MVLVTHDMDEAERLCDRVAVLHDGRLLTCGRPVELITATGTVRVRFSCPGAAGLEGLAGIPGVGDIGYDGGIANVTAAPVPSSPSPASWPVAGSRRPTSP